MDDLTLPTPIEHAPIDTRTSVDFRVDVRSFGPDATGELVSRFLGVGLHNQRATPGRIPADVEATRHRLTTEFGWHATGQARHFVARVAGVDVGRCSAFVDSRAVDASGQQVGYIGHWECTAGELGEPASQALLEVASGWLRDEGCMSALGPIDFSTWHGYRFMSREDDDGRPPCLLEPVTSAHALDQWQAFGFTEDVRYFSAEIADPAEQVELARPLVRELVAGGWRIEQLRMRDWDDLMERAHVLSNAEFTRQPHFTPIDLDGFRALYQPFRQSLDPRYVFTAWAPDGTFAGYVLGVRELGAAARALAGAGPKPARVVRAAWAAWAADTVLVKTICVAKPYRSLGIAIFLQSALYRTAIDTGHPRIANMLMHENNRSRFLTEIAGGVPFRRYVTLRITL